MIVLLVIAGLIVGGIVGDGGRGIGWRRAGIEPSAATSLSKGRLDSLESELASRDRRRWTESPATTFPAQNLEPQARPAPRRRHRALDPRRRHVLPKWRDPRASRRSRRRARLFEPASTSGAADLVIEEPWRVKTPEVTDSAAVRWVRDYFMNGNLVVRVGLIVLFFGVAFLLKFAAEHTHAAHRAAARRGGGRVVRRC